MVRVNAALQLVAQIEQAAVAGGEFAYERTQTVPESVRLDAGSRQGFPFDEVVEDFRHAQAGELNALHGVSLPVFSAPAIERTTMIPQLCPVQAMPGRKP